MTSTVAVTQPSDIAHLIAAVARNTESGGLRKFLELHRWKALAEYLRPVKYGSGDTVINQGEMDRRLYFVESGELSVDMHTGKGIVHLATVGAGSVVGEGSFFSRLPRIAVVTASTDCKVWVLTPEEFDRLSLVNSGVALAVSMALGTLLAVRMLDMSKRVTVL
jgi:CRP/FNR family cyclic AMP-dependent transcriptional regulator